MERLGILVGPKGRGSNMVALAEACSRGEVPAVVGRVLSSNPDSPALARAHALQLPTAIVPVQPEESYGARLVASLSGCTWVCLAGYVRLLPVEVLRAFPRRVLNIHPALLPRHGGRGMYGDRVHEAVLAAGDSESGCTVHYVSEHYDEGEIVLQLRCDVQVGDTVATLSARVLELEHVAYPRALAEAFDRA